MIGLCHHKVTWPFLLGLPADVRGCCGESAEVRVLRPRRFQPSPQNHF